MSGPFLYAEKEEGTAVPSSSACKQENEVRSTSVSPVSKQALSVME